MAIKSGDVHTSVPYAEKKRDSSRNQENCYKMRREQLPKIISENELTITVMSTSMLVLQEALGELEAKKEL